MTRRSLALAVLAASALALLAACTSKDRMASRDSPPQQRVEKKDERLARPASVTETEARRQAPSPADAGPHLNQDSATGSRATGKPEPNSAEIVEPSIHDTVANPEESGVQGGVVGGVIGGVIGGTLEADRDSANGVTPGTEWYAHAPEASFRSAVDAPLSTFAIDVDTASYSNVRRFLLDMRQLPPPDAVRIEEMLNTFRYDDPPPRGPDPFSVTTETASCPWNADHRLLRIGLRGRSIAPRDLPRRNLVFLVDVSGSMDAQNKLPLVQRGLRELAGHLDARDTIAIVVYAGAAGLVLEPTPASQNREIVRAIEGLRAGGSTNGAGGIELAYRLADESFVEGAANRVVLCTDGDFNVGMTSQSDLVHLIEVERDKGVFLTVLGYGMGNLKDSTMEALADHGNGNYAYVDSIEESRKVLVDEADAWLVTIAKDVKLQVEMNPRAVESYRLIGYDNRRLADEDFEDDRKDAGDMGAGHAVVALYEIVPAKDRRLRYQDGSRESELGYVKMRWKDPDGDTSVERAQVIPDADAPIASASADMRFAAAVATFGLALKGSDLAPHATFATALELASGALGRDPAGRRTELVKLIGVARELSPGEPAVMTTR